MKRALIAMGMALCFFGQVQAQNDDFGDDFKEDFESFVTLNTLNFSVNADSNS